jgi:tetratricopeptide (TPR) repeat protein
MNARSHLLATTFSIRRLKARRLLIKIVGLICLCIGLLFSLQYHFTAVAQTQPTQTQQTNVNRLIDECFQLSDQANYQQAITTCQAAAAAARDINNRSRESDALIGLGNAHLYLGQYPRAIEFYEQSLDIFQAIGDRNGEARSLLGLGEAYRSLGQYPRAIEFYEQSLDIKKAIGDSPEERLRQRNGEANSLNNLGLVYYARGRYQNSSSEEEGKDACEYAITCYQQSLAITQAIGDRNMEGRSLNNLGLVYYAQGQYQDAIDYFNQSLQISRTIGDRQSEAYSLNGLGYALFRTNRLNEAETYLHQSIEVLETLRLNLSDADKLSLFETLTNPYYNLQYVLVTQEKNAEALEIAERGRARACVELLAQRLAPEDVQNLVQVQVADAITIGQIKQVAHKQHATLVEYSIAHASRLYIWVVSPSGNIAFRWVDLSQLESSLSNLVTKTNASIDQGTGQTNTALSLLVQGTRSAIDTASDTRTAEPSTPNRLPSIPADDPRFEDGLRQLYQILIDPIQDLLPTNPEDHVIFIPHNALFLTPFPALQALDDSS